MFGNLGDGELNLYYLCQSCFPVLFTVIEHESDIVMSRLFVV